MKFSTRSNLFIICPFRTSFLLTISILTIFISFANAARKSIPSEEVSSRIKISPGPVISGSDSVLTDRHRLVRNKDYRFDYLNGAVFLNLSDSLIFDTLHVYYSPLPSWLKDRYGADVGQTFKRGPQTEGNSQDKSFLQTGQRGREIKINGAKRFSFLSRTVGGSEFNQSLELTIDGKLNDDLTVTGSVSDRGYDPAYGTVNSRISELDKINMTVRSSEFFAEIGDLEVRRDLTGQSTMMKQVSGLQSRYQSRHFTAGGILGRPRGEYETVKFFGADQSQGPYRIISGRNPEPIVPGSEQVWVDGRPVQRGADKDYVMDYPAASITFTSRVPIDSRSRIEIDFEPLSSDYERELYGINAGAAISDSVFLVRVDYVREGDDENRPESGILSESDLDIIGNAGDNAAAAVRDGAVADSNGAYIQQVDEDGTVYYEYVGEPNGEYDVTFSLSENGAYVFEGGERYRYVGAGNGEYDAVVKLPIPQREEHYSVGMGFRPTKDFDLNVDLAGARRDRNLLSNIDDDDNSGLRYQFSGRYGAIPRIGLDGSGIIIRGDLIEEKYKSYYRLNIPDIGRRYLFPNSIDTAADRHEYGVSAASKLIEQVGVYASADYIEYEESFRALRSEVSLYPVQENSLLPVLTGGIIDAEDKSSGEDRPAEAYLFRVDWKRDFQNRRGVNLWGRIDRRENEYTGEKKGTTEREAVLGVSYGAINISFERYDEDTLIGQWRDRLVRDRLTADFGGKLLGITTDWYLTAQRLSQGGLNEDQLLARVNWRYSRPRSNLSLSGYYTISDENRFQRGIRYVEVEPGRGDFILEGGEYIPDPDGNYIEVEEILSEQAGVQSGEKSFSMTWQPRKFYVRLVSNISEEMFDSEDRGLGWLLPVYSDGSRAYFLRRLYYSGDIKLGRKAGYYLANLSGSYNSESRRIASVDNERYDWQAELAFHEAYASWHFLQRGGLFESRRDQYYNSPGNIEGYEIALDNYYISSWGRFNTGLKHRFAEDGAGAVSRQALVEFNPIVRYLNGGESSLKLTGYYQELENAAGASYRLTDNRSGKLGFVWTLRADYKVSKAVRLSIFANGRHADDRRPRFTGKGEMVASF